MAAFSACNLVQSRQPHLFPCANRHRLFISGAVLVLKRENRSGGVMCLAGLNLRPSVVKSQVREWCHKQCLLVGAVTYSAYCFFEGFVWGFLLKKFHDATTPFEISDLRLGCALTGEYSPLFTSMMAISPVMSGLCFAGYVASFEFITFVIEKLRGKKSYAQTKMAGGFGAGIILCLATGMTAPVDIILAGVICAQIFAIAVEAYPTRGNRSIEAGDQD